MMFIIIKYAATAAAIGCCFKRTMDPPVILNTNKIQEKICAEILYKPVFNSYEIVGLIFSKF